MRLPRVHITENNLKVIGQPDILQEKVEVIRAKKPHIVEPVRVKPQCGAEQQAAAVHLHGLNMLLHINIGSGKVCIVVSHV